MKTITVRGLDDTMKENLQRVAKQEGKSLNQFIVDTLKDRLGLKKQKKYTVSTTTWIIFLVYGLKMSLDLFNRRSIQNVR